MPVAGDARPGANPARLRGGVLEGARHRRADRDDAIAACARGLHRGDRRRRQVVRLVERQLRVERGIAGRRQAGGMGQRREADAARAEAGEQLPVEDEAGRRRFERDRLRSDRGPDVPQRERRGDVRVLDRPTVPGDAGADRIGSAGEAQLDQARCGDDAKDGCRERPERERVADLERRRQRPVLGARAPVAGAEDDGREGRDVVSRERATAGEANLDRRAGRAVSAGETRRQRRGVVGDDEVAAATRAGPVEAAAARMVADRGRRASIDEKARIARSRWIGWAAAFTSRSLPARPCAGRAPAAGAPRARGRCDR